MSGGDRSGEPEAVHQIPTAMLAWRVRGPRGDAGPPKIDPTWPVKRGGDPSGETHWQESFVVSRTDELQPGAVIS